jgi:hypothetical protein
MAGRFGEEQTVHAFVIAVSPRSFRARGLDFCDVVAECRAMPFHAAKCAPRRACAADLVTLETTFITGI